MSGGSYNYTYQKLLQLYIKDRNKSPVRNVIQTLAFLMADVLHDIEWIDSGDYGGDEDVEASLDKLLWLASRLSKKPQTEWSLEEARKLQAELLDKTRLEELDSKSDDDPDSL